jgi:hypothetical protein
VATHRDVLIDFGWRIRSARRVGHMGGPGRLKTPALLVFLVPLRRPGNLSFAEPA